jgi:hypothetical protein
VGSSSPKIKWKRRGDTWRGSTKHVVSFTITPRRDNTWAAEMRVENDPRHYAEYPTLEQAKEACRNVLKGFISGVQDYALQTAVNYLAVFAHKRTKGELIHAE